MQTSFKEFYKRLETIMQIKGIKNAAVLSKELGYKSPAKIYRLAEEGNSPSVEILSDIAKTYPDINTRWLLLGEGEPLNNNKLENSPKPETHNGKTVPEYDSIHIRETLKYVREELERQHTQLVKTTRATEELERELKDLKAQVKSLAS